MTSSFLFIYFESFDKRNDKRKTLINMLQRDLKRNRKSINNFVMHEISFLKKIDLKNL